MPTTSQQTTVGLVLCATVPQQYNDSFTILNGEKVTAASAMENSPQTPSAKEAAMALWR